MVNKEIIIGDIQKSLNNRVCEDAGIIPVSIEFGVIEIGAMNPDFIRVKEVISDIKRRFNVEVVLKQITSSEWEEWVDVELTDRPTLITNPNDYTYIQVRTDSNLSGQELAFLEIYYGDRVDNIDFLTQNQCRPLTPLPLNPQIPT